jgi:hypothetical protein
MNWRADSGPSKEERAEATDCNQLSAADAANLRTYHPPVAGRRLALADDAER